MSAHIIVVYYIFSINSYALFLSRKKHENNKTIVWYVSFGRLAGFDRAPNCLCACVMYIPLL